MSDYHDWDRMDKAIEALNNIAKALNKCAKAINQSHDIFKEDLDD